MPLSALRRCCLLIRIASAGTPTTARTGWRLPFFGADERQQMAQQLARRLNVLLRAFLDQAPFERSMEVEHRAVVERLPADQQSRLSTLRATMSAGQPTKLSTTYCSPFDEEMALRDVPRSIPTLSTSLPDCLSAALPNRFSAALPDCFSGPLVPRLSGAYT